MWWKETHNWWILFKVLALHIWSLINIIFSGITLGLGGGCTSTCFESFCVLFYTQIQIAMYYNSITFAILNFLFAFFSFHFFKQSVPLDHFFVCLLYSSIKWFWNWTTLCSTILLHIITPYRCLNLLGNRGGYSTSSNKLGLY